MLVRNHIKRVIAITLLIFTTTSRQLTQTSDPVHSNGLLYIALILLTLLILLYIDKRRNFVWLTAFRHCLGDLILRARNYRKRNIDKSMRVQTEEVLPTPKTVHVQQDNQRPFIESEASSVLAQPLTSPTDPIAHEELLQRKEFNLKDVFQVKEHKSSSSKPKKQKKSKSKLKSRLQNNSGTEEEDGVNGDREREREREEERSFTQDGSVDEGVGRGSEVE